MNNYGLVVNDIGMHPLLSTLLASLVAARGSSHGSCAAMALRVERSLPALPPVTVAPPPPRGEGLPRPVVGTASGAARNTHTHLRALRPIPPPLSGEDGYVYPVGTASSVSWRVAHTRDVDTPSAYIFSHTTQDCLQRVM